MQVIGRKTNQTTPVQTVTVTVENLNTSADFSRATLTLRPNTTYTVAITRLDKTKTPTLPASSALSMLIQEINNNPYSNPTDQNPGY